MENHQRVSTGVLQNFKCQHPRKAPQRLPRTELFFASCTRRVTSPTALLPCAGNLEVVKMLLDQRKLDFAYEQIVQDAAKARGACTVIIFVAPNCDAMCACRILSYMLRADAVSYKIKPVAGYGDIAVANEELLKVRVTLSELKEWSTALVLP